MLPALRAAPSSRSCANLPSALIILSSVFAVDGHLRAVKHSVNGPPAEPMLEGLYWTSSRQLEDCRSKLLKRRSCKKSPAAEQHFPNALKALYPPFYTAEEISLLVMATYRRCSARRI